MTLAQFRQKNGVLLDTNLLILHIVGLCSPAFVERCKQTKRYNQADFFLLQNCLSGFQQFIITPHILAETSNLLEGQSYRGINLLSVLAAFVQESVVVERHVFGAEMARADLRCLTKFGFSDTAIAVVARENLLVLTDDLNLCAYLQNAGVDALNFQNLRTF
jgi:rRNA-processing protein FCF1